MRKEIFFEELLERQALDEVGNDEESGLLVDRSVSSYGYKVYEILSPKNSAKAQEYSFL